MTLQNAYKLIREPAVINAMQIIAYILSAVCGLIAAFGNLPFLDSIGPILLTAVGVVLALGSIVGAFAVLTGHWWLERVALLIVGTAWVCTLPAVFDYAFNEAKTGTIWLIVALMISTISDIFKRYRRIDWAYLDPGN